MADVVNGNSGTARSARLPIPGLTMAGKTGTAQAIGRKARPKGGEAALPWKYRNHAWFVAFAPVEAPRYAMSVFVEHGGGGSKAAAPIGRDVMTYLFEPGTAMKALEKIEEGWDLKKRERLAAQAAAAAEAQRAQAAAQAQTAAAMMAAPPPPPRSI
jgi:penicillin-binding protein 2